MSVLDMLTKQLSGDRIKDLSRWIGVSESTVDSAVKSALPVLVGALAKNAQKPDGAQALGSAVERDHDGSILDRLGDFLKSPDTTAGDGILGHVLGQRRGAVEQGISQQSGLDAGGVAKLLSGLAPVVMGAVGREKKKKGMDLVAMAKMLNVDYQKQLEEHRRKKESSPMAKLMGLIDQDDDGDVKDDIMKAAGSLGGFLKK